MSAPLPVHPNDIKWAVAPVREAMGDPKVRPAFPLTASPEPVDDMDVFNAAVLDVTPDSIARVREETGASDYMARRFIAAADIGRAVAGDESLKVLGQGEQAAPPRARSKWRAACWETRQRARKVYRHAERAMREGGTT